MDELNISSAHTDDGLNDISQEIDLIKIDDLNEEKTLPKKLIDLLNKQAFNGTSLIQDNDDEENNKSNLNENNLTSSSNNNSCNTSINSVNSDNANTNINEQHITNNDNNNDNNTTNNNTNHKDGSNTSSTSSILSQNDNLDHDNELYDQFDSNKYDENKFKTVSNSTIKRTHLINLIFELYDLNGLKKSIENEKSEEQQKSNKIPTIQVESFMEKLPPGKNLKNSILLAWKRRYFKLNSIGILYIYDIDDKTGLIKDTPDEIYNLMGGKVDYEQNKIISLDDGRGNYLVFRCCSENNELFQKWKQEIDSQIIDRSDSLWVKPNQPLTLNENRLGNKIVQNCVKKNVLIIDIGTCSIRAGLFEDEPKLPKLFVPTVCSRDINQKLKVGFDAFDFLLGSSAPSTIDLRKSMSAWSLSSNHSNQLIFPLKSKIAIDKLNVEFESIDAIIGYVVDTLNIQCQDTEVVLVTSHKLTDKLNIQYLNLLLMNERYQFKSAVIINQTLMALYSYNANVGIIANLGEKIEIVPICNGIPFQGGVTNLAYGGSCMSEFLNFYISRGHVSYVNDMEQFYVRFVKEKSCYTALTFQDELEKYPNDSKKFSLELTGRANELKKVEFPESARFRAVEGLFNPEIWGLDGQGIHKLIQKAIQSSSMDLRREMARNIYLCGGMSQIPGLKERLEKELRQLFPPTLRIKVNCSEYSYHSAYLGAFRFIQQPEYEKLTISRDEWISENVNCLRKWRTI